MLLLQGLLLLLTVGSTFSQMVRTMVYTKLNYTVDTKYWNLTMWLNGTRFNVFNVAGLITTGLTLDSTLNVNTDGSNGEFAELFTKHINVCEFLDKPLSEPLVHLITQTIFLNKNNHVMRKCPIAGGTYWIKDFTMTGEQLPPMMPNFAFYLTAQIYHLVPQRILLLDFRIDGIVENVSKKRLKSRRRISS